MLTALTRRDIDQIYIRAAMDDVKGKPGTALDEMARDLAVGGVLKGKTDRQVAAFARQLFEHPAVKKARLARRTFGC